ncbi:MAG: bi-domain-containing oxidoreductase, partial [Burkholderiales bacterium]
PAPQVGPKNILVQVAYSCISAGTEMASVHLSGLPLYRRALKQPEHVKRVLEMMREQGVKHTLNRVLGKLQAGAPTGYSAGGRILEIGTGVEGFQVGDRVACAGAGIANHAEIIDVPVNLAVRIPENLDTGHASTVTLGAIALQGVRRGNPTLGETAVVIGLGILGQLAAQLLKANGCRVIGVDVDSTRIDLALANGADFGADPSRENYVERIYRLTDGFGADMAIVTAATSSHQVISEAFQACRKKGRVVLVGDVGLNISRSDLYKKELDFLISTSYGPGRYDALYEEGGQDYPLPYVRWTENRNMETYLQLLASGQISLENIPQERYPVNDAPRAYSALKREGQKPLVVLLEYPQNQKPIERKIALRKETRDKDRLRVALAGAGGFAQAVHLPNLLKLRKHFHLRCVMSRTGSNARAIATKYEAEYATTDYEQVLRDPDIDLVIVVTRHNLHADMVLKALRAGKHAFVEKPLAINAKEADAIEEFYRDNSDAPMLMTGFNRRFSPAMQKVKEILASKTTPIIANYRMNAGYIPREHWVHGEEGAGRNIGEACHIYDLFVFLAGDKVAKVSAASITPPSAQWARNDNFVATVSFKDGSICTLTYTALGDKSYPKERMEIFTDGKVLSLDDYKSLTALGSKGRTWSSPIKRKGQLEELQALAASLREGGSWPITLDEQLTSARISFEVERQINP